MKAAFLCEHPKDFERVYSPELISSFQEITEISKKCYTRQDVLDHPELFADTAYLFSTWGMSKFTEEEIRSLFPKLECVFYSAGTVQAFARPFLNAGVKVFSAWAANAVPVAEYTTAQIILSNKGFFKSAPYVSRGNRREGNQNSSHFRGNYGVKTGLIGVGMIGKLVAKMLRSYRLEVLAFDPFLPDDTAAELGVEKTSLERIFSECTVVSNHLANNAQTKGMLNRELFEKMLPYATFINTGRGAQVVEDDLISILQERPDLTAILDVTDPEPPVPDSPFYSLENCILTPHIAGSSGDEVHRMAEYMREEFLSYLKGDPCRYEVSLEMLKTMA